MLSWVWPDRRRQNLWERKTILELIFFDEGNILTLKMFSRKLENLVECKEFDYQDYVKFRQNYNLSWDILIQFVHSSDYLQIRPRVASHLCHLTWPAMEWPCLCTLSMYPVCVPCLCTLSWSAVSRCFLYPPGEEHRSPLSSCWWSSSRTGQHRDHIGLQDPPSGETSITYWLIWAPATLNGKELSIK